MAEDNKKLTFPQFDVVSDFSDHRFVGHNSSIWKKAGKSCFKAISKEWRILRESLPDSIFVRVSETRYDLLRAAIIGAAGTPYHDALFFFDIVVTPNYPKEAPKVYYHSHGHRINPNLYNDGVVCLSLLNTWMGSSQSEHWNPKLSTLLQVLLSLQSLVLNEKPYYNEPGRRYSGNNKASEYYSQDVFLLTCKTTINLIRNPPRNFEPLISHHFRERGKAILAACEAYANGRVMVGLYGCDGAAPAGFEIRRGFQTDMEVVYAQLVKEFRRVEACVPVAGERLGVIQKPSVINLNKQEREGIFKKMIEKIIDVLGLNKNNNGEKKASSGESIS